VGNIQLNESDLSNSMVQVLALGGSTLLRTTVQTNTIRWYLFSQCCSQIWCQKLFIQKYKVKQTPESRGCKQTMSTHSERSYS
jgi:hypothetical protein